MEYNTVKKFRTLQRLSLHCSLVDILHLMIKGMITPQMRASKHDSANDTFQKLVKSP